MKNKENVNSNKKTSYGSYMLLIIAGFSIAIIFSILVIVKVMND